MLRTAVRPALDFHKPSAVWLAGGACSRGILNIRDSLCLRPRFTSLQKSLWQRDSPYFQFPMPPAAIYLPPEGYLAEGFLISAIPYASGRDLPPSRRSFGRGIPNIPHSLCRRLRFIPLQKPLWQRDSKYPRFPMPPAAICCPMGSYPACPLSTKSLRATECQGLAASRCEAPLILQGSQIESPTGAGK